MNVKHLISATVLAGSLVCGAVFAADTTEKVDDAWITAKVKTDLAADTTTKAHNIHVNTKSGVVVLTGHVTSAAEKAKAETDARAIKGVVNVENQLVVQNK